MRTYIYIATFILLLFAACHGDEAQQSASESAASDARLKIALLPTAECAPLVAAATSGLADSLGLPLQVVMCRSQWDADTLLLRGHIDVAYCDSARADYYRRRGQWRDMQCVATTRGVWSLVVGGQLRVKSLNRLSGRTLAVSRYAAGEHWATEALRQAGVARSSVLRTQINDFALRTAMLRDGQVDAAMLPQPFADSAKVHGAVVLYTTPRGVETGGIWMRRNSLSAQQVAVLKRLATGQQ
ncbi:MAG: ABC transporter substrate-binding protein [Bacteroidales bacterium]|nr:ABC transporter substrate-binding protein [Candidatus Equimonas enterica]